ncbi:MAG: FxLYD domain-containing protein [Thermoanaerobaculia bacterium]
MRFAPALAAVLLAAATGPAGADWLVTREGGRLETLGPWQTRGKLVVFHTPAGVLSSMRLAEVDLDASRRATAEAERARLAAAEAGRKAPAKKASVLVVTDDKVRHVEPAGAAGAPAGPASAIRVSNWERTTDPTDGHVIITGTVQNTAGAEATDITLTVRLLDAAGKTAATGQGLLSSATLPPGQQSGFRVDFLNVTTYADVKFEARAVTLAPAEPRPEPPPSPGGG